MDHKEEIRARLPIEELVGGYCQLKKKGRSFACMCPFHNDSNPSMLVSPDKGLAYCFVCNSGGDIFSFYQQIEGVDFPTALKDLAERTGVELPELPKAATTKDEKERLKDCLKAAQRIYKANLTKSEKGKVVVTERQLDAETAEVFGVGVAEDSFSALYDALLKEGFSKSEIVKAGLAVEKDLNGKIYDRFRNRFMFPICDTSGDIIGFGGRTLGDDDAKYINSAEGPLYHKSLVLYGIHLARKAMRETKNVVLVEGYFDVIACHRIGIQNVVAVSGTALTEEHAKLLKRSVDSVTLCLDQDTAGKKAARRAFQLCSSEGLSVNMVNIAGKDPDEAAREDPEKCKDMIENSALPYLDAVLAAAITDDIHSAAGKKAALEDILPLIASINSSVEREHYTKKLASVIGSSFAAVQQDLDAHIKGEKRFDGPQEPEVEGQNAPSIAYSSLDITLGLLILYPFARSAVLPKLIAPSDTASRALYEALKQTDGSIGDLLDDNAKSRATLLELYCEHGGMGDWNENLALKEIERNCTNANKDRIRIKQNEISLKLQKARLTGNTEDEQKLLNDYQEVLKLAKMVR